MHLQVFAGLTTGFLVSGAAALPHPELDKCYTVIPKKLKICSGTPVWIEPTPNQTPSWTEPTPNQTPSWIEPTPNVTPSWIEPSPNETPSWIQPSPNETPSWVEPSPNATPVYTDDPAKVKREAEADGPAWIVPTPNATPIWIEPTPNATPIWIEPKPNATPSWIVDPAHPKKREPEAKAEADWIEPQPNSDPVWIEPQPNSDPIWITDPAHDKRETEANPDWIEPQPNSDPVWIEPQPNSDPIWITDPAHNKREAEEKREPDAQQWYEPSATVTNTAGWIVYPVTQRDAEPQTIGPITSGTWITDPATTPTPGACVPDAQCQCDDDAIPGKVYCGYCDTIKGSFVSFYAYKCGVNGSCCSQGATVGCIQGRKKCPF